MLCHPANGSDSEKLAYGIGGIAQIKSDRREGRRDELLASLGAFRRHCKMGVARSYPANQCLLSVSMLGLGVWALLEGRNETYSLITFTSFLRIMLATQNDG